LSVGFNVALCEEESVSDLSIGKVIHQDFLNSSFGRHWTRDGSRPQIQQSETQLSML